MMRENIHFHSLTNTLTHTHNKQHSIDYEVEEHFSFYSFQFIAI